MQNQNIEQTAQESQTKRRKKWGLIFLLLLLLAGVGYSLYHVFGQKPKENVTVISGDFLPGGKDAKKMSDKELKKFAQKKVDNSQFNMMIGSKAIISSQSQQGTLNIKNPQTNTYPVNVVITDDQTGDVIYTSGAVEPGEEVSHIALEKPLTKGTHPATARFSLYDSKTKTKKGEVAAGVSFIVS